MCYKCRICNGVSEPGVPLNKYIMYRYDGQIEQEYPVCGDCKRELDNGACPRVMHFRKMQDQKRGYSLQENPAPVPTLNVTTVSVFGSSSRPTDVVKRNSTTRKGTRRCGLCNRSLHDNIAGATCEECLRELDAAVKGD